MPSKTWATYTDTIPHWTCMRTCLKDLKNINVGKLPIIVTIFSIYFQQKIVIYQKTDN